MLWREPAVLATRPDGIRNVQISRTSSSPRDEIAVKSFGVWFAKMIWRILYQAVWQYRELKTFLIRAISKQKSRKPSPAICPFPPKSPYKTCNGRYSCCESVELLEGHCDRLLVSKLVNPVIYVALSTWLAMMRACAYRDRFIPGHRLLSVCPPKEKVRSDSNVEVEADFDLSLRHCDAVLNTWLNCSLFRILFSR